MHLLCKRQLSSYLYLSLTNTTTNYQFVISLSFLYLVLVYKFIVCHLLAKHCTDSVTDDSLYQLHGAITVRMYLMTYQP